MSGYLTRQMLDPASYQRGTATEPGLFRKWMDAIAANARRRRMRADLERLEDRILADIGLERADIPSVVRSLDEREFGMGVLGGSGGSAAPLESARI